MTQQPSASAPTGSENGEWISWNGNITHNYKVKTSALTESDIQKAVLRSPNIRPLGTGQSSADIVAGPDDLIDMRRYNQIIEIDRSSMQIRVESGILLSELLRSLEDIGWTIPCLPDNDSITLGGAISTGTHGTSGGGKTLSEYMVGCRIVDARGNIREYGNEHEHMPALRVSMGLLGVFTEITLQCEPLTRLLVREEPVKDEIWLDNWQDWLKEHYFLRLLWIPHSGYAYKITADPLAQEEAKAKAEERRIELQDAPDFVKHRREFSRFLYSWDSPGFTRFSNRLIRRLFFNHRKVHTGSLYESTVTKKRSSTLELAEWTADQKDYSELFLNFRSALESDPRAFAHIPMDIRFLSGDGSWLSNAYDRDIVTMGCVTRKPYAADRYRAFDIIEEQFLSFGGRPHWAKRFKAGRETLEKLYPKYEEFVALRRDMDPDGKFLNSYLGELFS